MDDSQSPATVAAPAVCAAWFGTRPLETAPIPVTGFSGVPVVRVRPHGTPAWFVLKAFAAATPRHRAEWGHAFARHLFAAGIHEVPPPLATPEGQTVVADARGMHWELAPFVEGTAAAMPRSAQAAAALATLARLHVAAAAWPDAAPRVASSPGIERRLAQCRGLLVTPWTERLALAVAAAAHDPFLSAVGARWDRAIGVFRTADGPRAVAAVVSTEVAPRPLQAVLRDVWHAHVLFAPQPPERVAGIVDLHAAAIDVPATDIARLVGSWRKPDAVAQTADPAAAWPEAIAAYEAVRPLTAVERRLVPFLHAAGVVCGLDNWFRWTLEERRSFAVPGATLGRIDELLAALPAALESLAEHGPIRV